MPVVIPMPQSMPALPDVPGWPEPDPPLKPYGIRYWDVWPKAILLPRTPCGGEDSRIDLVFTGEPDLDHVEYATDNSAIASVSGGVITAGMATGDTCVRVWEPAHPEHVRLIRVCCVPSACTKDELIQSVGDENLAGEDTGHYVTPGHVHRGSDLDEERILELIEERLADLDLTPRWVRTDA